MQPTRQLPLITIIRNQAIAICVSAAVTASGGAALWVWTKINALEDAVAAQEMRLGAHRDTNEERYRTLRDRTDAAATELARRITTLEGQNAQIMVHVLEVVRAVSRIEARLYPSRTPPMSREPYESRSPD